jgi:hypothetical protein
MVSVKGQKVAISELIQEYSAAHESLWEDGLNLDLPYFVQGTIDKVIRREKVWYINFANINNGNGYFLLVVFEKYFKHFSYKDKELIGKEILAYGYLRKNTYTSVKEKQYTEMAIKSNDYIIKI